jgi:hypothetical protein
VLADDAGDRYVVSVLGERPPWIRTVRDARIAADYPVFRVDSADGG